MVSMNYANGYTKQINHHKLQTTTLDVLIKNTIFNIKLNIEVLAKIFADSRKCVWHTHFVG